MPTGVPTTPETKATIIRKIREEGMSVADAAEIYKASPKSIYRWLREGVVDGNRNLILENKKLQKELEIAYRIIGRFTADAQRPKR